MADATQRRIGFEEFTGLTLGRAVLLALPALALVVGAIWLAVQFLDPLPPRRIVLATGPEGSALHALGLRYAERIAAQGLAVDVRTTHGPAESLTLLGDRKARVDAAFLPAGMANADQAGAVVNVSNLFYAPLWCLGMEPSGDLTLAALRGRRVVIGAPDSGLDALLRPLLAANGVTAGNATLLEMSPEESVRALQAGEVDVICLGEGLRGPHFEQALRVTGVRVLNFPRADAYERRFPHIVRLRLPQGTVDLARGIPDRELSLIGTTLLLAARADLHPTVVDLLVDAARQLHSAQGIFERRGEFPHLHAVDAIPVSEQAVQYTREGPSFLRRYLPLWAADAVQRAVVLAVPLLAVLFPLARYLPAILDVIGRRRLFVGYARLRRVERTLRVRSPGAPDDDLLREIDQIEESVTGVKESVIKAGELYTFRVHVRVVRESVLARRRPSAGTAGPRDVTAPAGEAP